MGLGLCDTQSFILAWRPGAEINSLYKRRSSDAKSVTVNFSSHPIFYANVFKALRQHKAFHEAAANDKRIISHIIVQIMQQLQEAIITQ